MDKNIRPFHFWCQKVLPLVYDDSLSYYEVLCKLKDKINEVIFSFEDIQKEIEEYIQSPEFDAWLKMYIESRKIEIKSLAVIGDSNAEGYGWWGGNPGQKTLENDGYCAILRELYPDAVIDNYSVSGATLRGTSGNVAKAQCDLLISSTKNYDYVIIQTGMNDIGTIMSNAENVVGYSPSTKSAAVDTVSDYSTCVRALCSIVNRIRNLSPNTKIIYMVREYEPTGSSYLYTLYCAMYKQIFETCYILGVPVLNLESNFITSRIQSQKSEYFFDTIHWNENAYRYAVTPRLIEFMNNPISSGLDAPEYLILCCNINDIFRGNTGDTYNVTQTLRNALDYIRTDQPYMSFNGTFILTLSPGSIVSGSVNATNPHLMAKFRRLFYNHNVTVYINNTESQYFLENMTYVPLMGNQSYSGAEAHTNNLTGYGSISPNQPVLHQAYNDAEGNLLKIMQGFYSGEIMTHFNTTTGLRTDSYRGGVLGREANTDLSASEIQNGVYYIPYQNYGNVTNGLSQAQTGGYGYCLIVCRRLDDPTKSILFALSVTGVYFMLNYNLQWVKCAGVEE